MTAGNERGRDSERGAAPAEPAAPAPAAPEAKAGLPARRSLRNKAFITFAVVVGYVALVAAVLGYERQRLFDIVQQLERVHQQEELLGRVNGAAAHAALTVNDAYFMSHREPDWREVALAVEAVQAGLLALSRYFPEAGDDAGQLGEVLASILRLYSRDALIDLREQVRDKVRRLEGRAEAVRSEKERLHASYRLHYDALALAAAGFALLGLVVFGSLAALFFTRVVWDLKNLQRRALQIVGGYRGPPLAVTRGDEIGDLMVSVNRMQAELRAREAHLELSREERLHKEKMAAVGSLAASIAHEINNPIAAIAGVAEEIAETRSERQCPHHGAACRPDLILEHARRVATITRQIAIFSAPQSPEPQLTDLNGMIESTCNFVRYDPRYRAIELVTDLDRQLPALELVPDHVTQVLMNLLVNAADALATVEDRPRRVTVATRALAGEVQLVITDNGPGMAPDVLARAFDEYYSTKPTGKGSGLGLALCRRLVARMQGAIDIESEPGRQTTVRIRLPLPGGMLPAELPSLQASSAPPAAAAAAAPGLETGLHASAGH